MVLKTDVICKANAIKSKVNTLFKLANDVYQLKQTLKTGNYGMELNQNERTIADFATRDIIRLKEERIKKLRDEIEKMDAAIS